MLEILKCWSNSWTLEGGEVNTLRERIPRSCYGKQNLSNTFTSTISTLYISLSLPIKIYPLLNLKSLNRPSEIMRITCLKFVSDRPRKYAAKMLTLPQGGQMCQSNTLNRFDCRFGKTTLFHCI